jgi:hypothetical protein
MFNAGGEVALFKDWISGGLLNVLSGSRMPNLIYMVAFANAAAREGIGRHLIKS